MQALRALTALSLVPAYALVFAHLLMGDETMWIGIFHAATGYWAPLLGVPLLAAIGLGAPRVAGAALPPVAMALLWLLPGTLASGSDAQPTLRVVSSNVLMVNADPQGLVAEVFSTQADVVLFQEYSPRFSASAAHHSEQDYPFAFERPAEHSFGYAVFSRFPLEDLEEIPLEGVTLLEFTVRTPEGPVRMANIHALPPVSGNVELWHAELQALGERYAQTQGPLVVAGDLNATRHHPSFQHLLQRGDLQDAHAEVGRAHATTWPNGLFGLVPGLRLDHVLVRDLEVVAVREGRAVGTDHNPVIADLSLR